MNTEAPPPPNPTLNPPPVSDQLTPDERTWAAVAHASAFCTVIGIPSFVGPLIVYVIKKEQSAFVADQAKEALNFHLTILFAVLVCVPLVFCVGIGVVMAIGVLIASLVLTVIASVKASNGEAYRYPFTVRLLK